MKIGVYASRLAGQRGHERNVSGHIQVPLQTARLLAEAGHDVVIITNQPGPEHTFPEMMPADVPVRFVTDARHRPEDLRGGRLREGVKPFTLLKQILQLRSICRRERLDLLHVFGYMNTAHLGAMVATARPGCSVVATVLSGNLAGFRGRLSRFLFSRLGAVVTATQYAASRYGSLGIDVKQRRHGIIRDFTTETGADQAGPRHRILFWRDGTRMNGADVTLEAFRAIAAEYPDLSFDFAIRPVWDEIAALADPGDLPPNVTIHRFPYPEGITIARLINESLLIVLPFRRLSIDPQFAIAESLAAGVPVLTTDVESCPELVRNGVNGAIVPAGDAAAIIAALRSLLDDRDRLGAMGRAARETLQREWSWAEYIRGLEAIYARLHA